MAAAKSTDYGSPYLEPLPNSAAGQPAVLWANAAVAVARYRESIEKTFVSYTN